MKTKNKLIVVGPGRIEILRYLGDMDGDYVFIVDGQVLGWDVNTIDHSRKRHLHFESDRPLTDEVVAIMAKHPEFRITYYYVNDAGKGMFVSKHGKVVREKIKEAVNEF